MDAGRNREREKERGKEGRRRERREGIPVSEISHFFGLKKWQKKE